MMAENWYYAQNDQEHGPLTFEELTNLAKSGTLQPDNYVKNSATDQWQEAYTVDGLGEFLIVQPLNSDEPVMYPPNPLESGPGYVELSSEYHGTGQSDPTPPIFRHRPRRKSSKPGPVVLPTIFVLFVMFGLIGSLAFFSAISPLSGNLFAPFSGGSTTAISFGKGGSGITTGTIPFGGGQEYSVDLKAGTTYEFLLQSNDFDTQLELRTRFGKHLASNNDYKGRGARVLYHPEKTGEYRLVALATGHGRGGQFKLSMKKFVPKTLALVNGSGTINERLRGSFSEYAVKLEQGKRYEFQVNSFDIPTRFSVRDPSGKQHSSSYSNGRNSTMSIIPSATGNYVVRVGKFDRYGSSTRFGDFTLSVQTQEVTKLKLVKESATRSESIVRGGYRDYAVELKVGTRYEIRLNSTDFDAELILNNSFGSRVARNDDSNGTLNSTIYYTPGNTGIYTIRAQSLSRRSGGRYQMYVRGLAPKTLNLTKNKVTEKANLSPNNRDEYLVKLHAGSTYILTMKSSLFRSGITVYSLGSSNQLSYLYARSTGQEVQGTFTPTRTQTYRIVVSSRTYNRGGDYELSVEKHESKPLVLANNRRGSVNDILPNNGRISYPVELLKDQKYIIRLKTGKFNPYLELRNSSNLRVANSGFSGSSTQIIYTPSRTGKYQLIAQGSGQRGGGLFDLTVDSWERKNLTLPSRGGASTTGELKPDGSTEVVVSLMRSQLYLITVESDDFQPKLELHYASSGQLIRTYQASKQGQPLEALYSTTSTTPRSLIVSSVSPSTQKGKYRISVRPVLRTTMSRPTPLQNVSGSLATGAIAEYTVTLNENTTYTFELESADFDAAMELRRTTSSQDQVWGSHKSGKTTRFHYRPHFTGAYYLRVQPSEMKGGKFRLSVFRGSVLPEDGELVKKITEKLKPGTKKTYEVNLQANTTYGIELTGKELNGFLDLYPQNYSAPAAFADTVGESKQARIVYRPSVSGTYRIVTTAATDSNIKEGTMELTVTKYP